MDGSIMKGECTACDGRGKVLVRTTETFSEYVPCQRCGGTGLSHELVEMVRGLVDDIRDLRERVVEMEGRNEK